MHNTVLKSETDYDDDDHDDYDDDDGNDDVDHCDLVEEIEFTKEISRLWNHCHYHDDYDHLQV